MKKSYLIFAVVVVIALAAAFVLFVKPMLDDRTVAITAMMTIDRPDIELAFRYPSGEAAYTLIEPPLPEDGTSPITDVFLIMPTPEYIDYQNGKGITPPSVSVFVIPQPESTVEGGRIARLQNWAENNPQFSSFTSVTSEPEVVEVDGAKALKYLTDGTYKQEVYLVSYSGNIYIFTGQYEEEDDQIRQMFTTFMSEVTFY